jgi:DNA repair protein RecO (recombination protein O)
MRVDLQPAYILHSRPYRDSSAILEALTAEHGRISLVARGARRRNRGGSNIALLQSFTPLLLSFTGRGELKTLTANESAGAAKTLRGERLFSGLYVNELLMRLLHRHDPHPALFAAYDSTLDALAVAPQVESVLRRFEFTLLEELGYSFDLHLDGRSGEAVSAEHWYHFHSDYGLVARGEHVDPQRPAFMGADLLAIAAGDLTGEVRLTAKRLLRQVLATHLGDAPLNSRELFRFRRASGKGEKIEP